MNFCVAILILKMKENMQHFQYIMVYYFKKGKNTTQKRFVPCMEKVLWLIERVKSGLRSFMLEVSRWMVLHRLVDQLKLLLIKLRLWERSTLYHMGGSWHSQNIQVNEVTGEKWKICLLFYGKTTWTLWPTQKLYSHPDKVTFQVDMNFGGDTIQPTTTVFSLGIMVGMYVAFKETSKLFSKMVVSFDIFTSSIWGLKLFHNAGQRLIWSLFTFSYSNGC